MKQNKRGGWKNNSGLLGLVILVVVSVEFAFLVAPPQTSSHSAVQPSRGEDAFYGNITNFPFRGQTTGVVKADTNCKPVENGLTNCIGIITAADGTEIHFNYTHDMSKQSCLTAEDRVTITLVNGGIVKVVRG